MELIAAASQGIGRLAWGNRRGRGSLPDDLEPCSLSAGDPLPLLLSLAYLSPSQLFQKIRIDKDFRSCYLITKGISTRIK